MTRWVPGREGEDGGGGGGEGVGSEGVREGEPVREGGGGRIVCVCVSVAQEGERCTV